MKVAVCDQCLVDGKLTMATYNRGYKGLKMHACNEHKSSKCPMTREQILVVLTKAEKACEEWK